MKIGALVFLSLSNPEIPRNRARGSKASLRFVLRRRTHGGAKQLHDALSALARRKSP